MPFTDLNIDWDRISKMKFSYDELSKVQQGDSGLMTYYPVDPEEHNKWFEEQKAKEKLKDSKYPQKKDIKP